jgi:6-phosphofructokinase 2
MEAILTLTLNPAIDLAVEVDELAPQRKLRTSAARYGPGGGGINVARAIQRCGGSVRAVFTAGGPLGDLLVRLVEQEAVTGQAIRIEGDTRESITVQVAHPSGLYRFVLPGPALTPTEGERCLAALAEADPPARYWVASGSLPEGLGDDYYARVARLARRQGARLILDTSGPALAAAVEEGVYLIKPNAREFGGLVGRQAADAKELRAQARELVASGNVELVVLSLGGEGALLTSADEQIECRPPSVEQRSSVGAGDSFVALLTLKLAAGRPLREALQYAVAAGTAAVTTPATELFHPQEMEHLYKRLQRTSGS